MKKRKPDNLPRFGYCAFLDNDPQIIRETRDGFAKPGIDDDRIIPVAVIPMPCNNGAARARVRRLVKDYWWPMT